MKLRSPSTFAALLLLLVISPAIFQGLDNLKRDVQLHMQATLWGVFLKFNGQGAGNPATPVDGRIRHGGNAPAICSDAPATKRQRTAEPEARLMTARRKSRPAPNHPGVDPVNGLLELSARADAVAGAQALAQPRVAAVWPAADVAPEAVSASEVADASAAIAAAAPPRPPLPRVPTEAPSLGDLPLRAISFAPEAHRQARIVLKHAAELERASRREWRQMIIKSQIRLVDPIKAKPCREAERKESETRAERQGQRLFIFTDETHASDTTSSEE